MSMDLLGAAPASVSSGSGPQVRGAGALDDLFGGGTASLPAVQAGHTPGSGIDNLLAGEQSASARAVLASPAAKAAQFAELFSESLKPKPRMRDMTSPSVTTAPPFDSFGPDSVSTAGVEAVANSAAMGHGMGGALPHTAANTSHNASLVFDVFTELAQKDGIIAQTPGGTEDAFGAFVSDAAFGAEAHGGAGFGGQPLSTVQAVADDDFGGDFGAFEGADSGEALVLASGAAVQRGIPHHTDK